VNPTARFAALVARPEAEIALDEAALVVAAHAYPDLDVAAELARIDRLVPDSIPRQDLDAWSHLMFTELGFSGNVASYYDPQNSFLNDVVGSRRGLPITLSVVGIALAQRLDLTMVGIGMPGHFLLRSAEDDDVFVDPFAAGLRLDRAGCQERFHAVIGRDVAFSPGYLDPVGPRALLTRLLANLKSIFAHSGDSTSLEWVLDLRLTIPGVPLLERRDRARLRASAGRFGEAADELEELAFALPDLADDLEAEAIAARARLN